MVYIYLNCLFKASTCNSSKPQRKPEQKIRDFSARTVAADFILVNGSHTFEGLNPQAADNLPYHILHIKKQKALSPKQDPASLNDDIGGLAALNFGEKRGGSAS